MRDTDGHPIKLDANNLQKYKTFCKCTIEKMFEFIQFQYKIVINLLSMAFDKSHKRTCGPY